MHTLTINVNNSSFERVMNFLKSENVDIIEKKKINELNIEPISKNDPDYNYILECEKDGKFRDFEEFLSELNENNN